MAIISPAHVSHFFRSSMSSSFSAPANVHVVKKPHLSSSSLSKNQNNKKPNKNNTINNTFTSKPSHPSMSALDSVDISTVLASNGHGMNPFVMFADDLDGTSLHNGDFNNLICTYATTDDDDATVPVSNGMDTSNNGDNNDDQDGSNNGYDDYNPYDGGSGDSPSPSTPVNGKIYRRNHKYQPYTLQIRGQRSNRGNFKHEKLCKQMHSLDPYVEFIQTTIPKRGQQPHTFDDINSFNFTGLQPAYFFLERVEERGFFYINFRISSRYSPLDMWKHCRKVLSAANVFMHHPTIDVAVEDSVGFVLCTLEGFHDPQRYAEKIQRYVEHFLADPSNIHRSELREEWLQMPQQFKNLTLTGDFRMYKGYNAQMRAMVIKCKSIVYKFVSLACNNLPDNLFGNEHQRFIHKTMKNRIPDHNAVDEGLRAHNMHVNNLRVIKVHNLPSDYYDPNYKLNGPADGLNEGTLEVSFQQFLVTGNIISVEPTSVPGSYYFMIPSDSYSQNPNHINASLTKVFDALKVNRSHPLTKAALDEFHQPITREAMCLASAAADSANPMVSGFLNWSTQQKAKTRYHAPPVPKVEIPVQFETDSNTQASYLSMLMGTSDSNQSAQHHPPTSQFTDNTQFDSFSLGGTTGGQTQGSDLTKDTVETMITAAMGSLCSQMTKTMTDNQKQMEAQRKKDREEDRLRLEKIEADRIAAEAQRASDQRAYYERKENADREERERREKEARDERVRSEERIIALVQSLINNGNSAVVDASAHNNNSMVSNNGDGNNANSNGISALTESESQSHLDNSLDHEMGDNVVNRISGVISPPSTAPSQHTNDTAHSDMDTNNNKRLHSATRQTNTGVPTPTPSPEKKKHNSSLTPPHPATPSRTTEGPPLSTPLHYTPMASSANSSLLQSTEDPLSTQLQYTPMESSDNSSLSTEMNITADGSALPVPSPPVIESMKDGLEKSPYCDAVVSTLRRRSSRINKESHVPNGNNE